MAISTADELLAALPAFAIRPDQNALWPNAIALAEAQMERELRVRPMLLRSDTTVDEEFEFFPDDMIEPVSLILKTDPVWEVEYVQPEIVNQMKFSEAAFRSNEALLFSSSPAPPKYYTVVGPQLQFFPAPQAAYPGELTYYQRLPPLSTNTQNWLLARHPDAYLYGSLRHFGIMTQDARLNAWTGEFTAALEAVRRAYPTPTSKAKLRMDPALLRLGGRYVR